MNDEPSNLLDPANAGSEVITDIVPALTEYHRELRTQIAHLSQFTLWQISGADATAFLQGQFCNDLAQVSTTQAQITGYCTPKGRLLALPTIVASDNGYRMVVPSDVAEAFVKRLRMFIMRSDVIVTPLEDWSAIGITAGASGELGLAQQHLGALPTGTLAATSGENSQLIRWHDDCSGETSRARYLNLAPTADQEKLLNACDDAQTVVSQTWRLADISAGVPTITQGVIEAFVPQMLNLQLLDALSFTKGCYPGQEIVARMQYLGKLKRHMRLFEVQLDAPGLNINEALQAGGALGSGADENAGVIVDAMPVTASMALVLAVTKVTTTEATFRLQGAPLTARELPYGLPTLVEPEPQ